MNFRIFIPTVFFLSLICQNPLAAQESGAIESDTTWEGEITVTGEVTIEVGARLTIEPGTVIKFEGNYSLIVNGLLLAEGVEGNSIQLISGNETPKAGDWGGIRFVSWQGTEHVLEHVRVAHASTGESGIGGVGFIGCC